MRRMSAAAPSFRALVVDRVGDGTQSTFKDLATDALAPGGVLIDVRYSSLNYKDGLAVTGRGKVIRRFPMVPGIDLSGRVLESDDPTFKAGDEVLAVGQGLGETLFGGYAGRARLPGSALVRVPPALGLKGAMAVGTAGFTAMLAVLALEHEGVAKSDRAVVVTGAAGGVGSVAVALLSAAGYRVAASTGRAELADYLRGLGAETIVDRTELSKAAPPLGSERWAGAVDTVGGVTLANLISTTAAFGAVAACGLAGGTELSTTVFPFILRNVSLLGINSVYPPAARRQVAWDRLAQDLKADILDRISTTAPLSDIHRLAEQILAGQVRGRVVIDVQA